MTRCKDIILFFVGRNVCLILFISNCWQAWGQNTQHGYSECWCIPILATASHLPLSWAELSRETGPLPSGYPVPTFTAEEWILVSCRETMMVRLSDWIPPGWEERCYPSSSVPNINMFRWNQDTTLRNPLHMVYSQSGQSDSFSLTACNKDMFVRINLHRNSFHIAFNSS